MALRHRRSVLQLLGIFLLLSVPVSIASPLDCAHPFAQLQPVQRYLNSYRPHDYEKFPIAFGVEVEAGIPKRLGFDGLGYAFESKLRNSHPELRTNLKFDWTENHYSGELEVDSASLSWKKNGRDYRLRLTEDYTVEANEDELPGEIISPTMSDQKDLKDFLEAIALARNSGASALPQTAGVHAHVDFANPRPGELAALALTWSRVEDPLKKIFGIAGRKRESYAQSFSAADRSLLESGRALIETDRGIPKLRQDLPNHERRNSALNLEALKRHGTVEFRLMNSTLDTEALSAYVDFTTRLVRKVRLKDPAWAAWLRSGKSDVRSLLSALGYTDSEATGLLEKLSRTAAAPQSLGPLNGD